jgi:hypothetical protein
MLRRVRVSHVRVRVRSVRVSQDIPLVLHRSLHEVGGGDWRGSGVVME